MLIKQNNFYIVLDRGNSILYRGNNLKLAQYWLEMTKDC